MRRLLAPAAAAFALALLLVAAAAEEEAEEDGSQEEVLGLIAAKSGETIADVGSGTGTWTVPLARAVGPSGRVYAVDIDPEAVAAVTDRLERERVKNVEVIQSVPDDPMLPAGSLDAVFLNDVIDYVDREALAGFLDGIRRALKPDGRLVIRDPNGGPDRVISECYRAGFALVEARVPLEGPARSFAAGWYALKLRRAEVQPPILPRQGRPARWRTRLHLAEELFRQGLLSRDVLRAKWEAIRDRPGAYDAKRDEARDLVEAARALGVLTDEEAGAITAAAGAPPR